MIGHFEIVEHLQSYKPFESIIIVVGTKPDWFNSHEQNNKNESTGLIYTERSRPKKGDLSFIKGANVQLIHGNNASDELFGKWYAETINSKPKTLVAVDSEKEIYVS